MEEAVTPVVLQDWTPIGGCLDFQLGQLAFQRRGAQAFTTHEVPNLVNQGGLSAVRAAEVLFASCEAADADGTLEASITVMEMAIGLGLHAVQFLDRFQRRCEEAGKDWYDRLTFYATDVTPKMLHDAAARGVFGRHEGRVRLAQADARRPDRVRLLGSGEVVDLAGALRMVLHTYLLCVLPANVFRCDLPPDGEPVWKVLVARTVLRRPDLVERFTDQSVAQLQAAFADPEPAVLVGLVDLYPLLDLDLSLAEFPLADHPERAELERILALQQTEAMPEDRAAEPYRWILHSAGAQESIARTLEALRPDGVLLYRDYGPGSLADADTAHIYQHYGPTTAIGIHHVALDSGHGEGVRVGAPEGEGAAAIKTRLVSRGAPESVFDAFQRAFATADVDALEAQIAEARSAGTVGAAIEGYRVALRTEPGNWALLGEAAEVALRNGRNLDLAEVLIREALRINPWSSAPAWNTLGDVLWFRDDLEGAEAAFTQATAVNPEHPRGWFNLYLCARQRRQLGRAVEMAARALAVDAGGEESTRLVAALRDAIDQLAQQRSLAAQLRRGRQAGSHR
ncbi:MAG: hypothetical protein RIT45_257 [Pseudomonadota bacterium]|jgi:tetratricopeptide (TPR) repeat protein